MRRLLTLVTTTLAAAALAACGADDATTSTTSTSTTSSTTTSGGPGEMQTGTPGADGTWAGQLGPVDMPPGPYAKAPQTLPATLDGWHASRGASGTTATYLPSEETGDAPGITVELHHGGQPDLKGSNDATIDGKVYCEPAGGSAQDRCAVPFEGGYLTLTPGEGMTQDQVVELGNALHALAEE